MDTRWSALLVIALGAFVGGFDTYALNLALPTLREAFRVDLAAVPWLVLAYLLTMVALLIPAGRLADARGPRAVFLAGLALVALGSLLAAGAPTFG
ncbi:MAG: MFS transporter, partial [Chloroflexota bacterium]|nr:MFS transporter [Chloroflexota bacterium]